MSTNINIYSLLVVQDDPLLRMVTSEMLTGEGYKVFEAEKAETALSSLLHAHPEISLLFTDVNMPGSLDGLDLATMLSKHYPALHLIITSGHEKPGQELLPGSSTFISKPYSAGYLTAMVSEKLMKI